MGRVNQYKPYHFYYARNGRLDLFRVVDLMTDRALVAGIGGGIALLVPVQGTGFLRMLVLWLTGLLRSYRF
jgi:hypothetical protein